MHKMGLLTMSVLSVLAFMALLLLVIKVEKAHAKGKPSYLMNNDVLEVEDEKETLGNIVYNEDADLTVPQLITKYGYPVEIHHVTTKDGYILELHRIPYGRKSGPGPKKPPVHLQHGFIASSADWIMNNEKKALAYELADNGYDVFLGNARGNTYSRNHTTLSPNDYKFWNFSFNEMGKYDIPAVIDYILGVTNQEKLYYVGHSMGTVMFWITMSYHPEYNSKIRLMTALAPVAYVQHIKSPIRLLAPFAKELELFEKHFGVGEFLPSKGFMRIFRKIVCQHEPIGEVICENIVFLMSGYDRKELNETMLPVILGHTPAGASSKTVAHFAQGIRSGKFRQFDYGKKKNMEEYGQEEPPEYQLSKVSSPVALFRGDNDWLADKEDINLLKPQLQNVVLDYRVPYEKFTHLDFLFAIDSNKLVYNKVLEMIKKY